MNMFQKIVAQSKTNLTNFTKEEAILLSEMVAGILANRVSLSALGKYVRNPENKAEFEKSFPGRKPYTVITYVTKQVQLVRPTKKLAAIIVEEKKENKTELEILDALPANQEETSEEKT